MTDLNDTQADTADSALTNWQTLSAPLATYAAEAQTMKNEIETALGALYEQAELSGDQDAKNRVMVAWERTQILTNQIVNMDAGLAGAGATIQTLNEQRRAALNELKSLVNAIEAGDEEHPQLEEFIQEIRQDEYEYAMEEASYYAQDQMAEILYDDMRVTFAGRDINVSKLMDILRGDYTVSPAQAAILRDFISSFDSFGDGVEESDDDDDQ